MLAYAPVRDDAESQRKFAEIRLRACQRIGVLSAELETAEQAKGGRHPTDGKPTKTDQLATAGISTSTANRYEELAGGKEQQAQDIATAAADCYFATANNEPVSMNGFKGAIRSEPANGRK
jgi:hypothetical protein